MENASKALLMAGGILLALLTLTLLVTMFNNVSTMEESKDNQRLAEELKEFNQRYEAYNKQVMYGADVITVLNMAQENNNTYADASNYKIVVKINGHDATVSDVPNTQTLYKCVHIGYSDDTGRVNLVEFQNYAD